MRADDPFCPFCGETLTFSLRQRAPRSPTARLGRAATMAFGAALAASTVTACGDGVDGQDDAGTTDDGGAADAGADAAVDGGIAPAYGAPADAGPVDGGIAPMYGAPADAGPAPDAGFDAGPDAGGVIPAYGAPSVDAGFQADAGRDSGGIAPLYGAPPGADE